MRIRSISFVVTVVLSVTSALLAAQSSAFAQGALDGRAFSIVSSNPEEAAYPDHLIFSEGTFESMGCRPFGFGPVAYTATAEGDAIAFAAEATSATEGTMSWSGRVTGDTIAGSYTWTKEGQDPVTGTWGGTAAAGSLDGRSFHVTAPEDPTQEDDLVFASGAFESIGCRPYGFFPVSYSTEQGADGSTTFNATSYSFTEGMMVWSGTITGDAIAGSYTWTKEGQDPQTAAFTGTASAAE